MRPRVKGNVEQVYLYRLRRNPGSEFLVEFPCNCNLHAFSSLECAERTRMAER